MLAGNRDLIAIMEVAGNWDPKPMCLDGLESTSHFCGSSCSAVYTLYSIFLTDMSFIRCMSIRGFIRCRLYNVGVNLCFVVIVNTELCCILVGYGYP